jgi:alkanesulfonate monooxygenase SsuD/methylene tetrahydromethanopterin reductase-like flavin-dependent oxidoreductase (luciferase family)
MKFHWFHLMPWPDLPDDFAQKHRSVWVDPDYSLYNAERGNHVYHEYLDELEYAEQCGYDGICVNEHHSNAYGMMPSPNIMAATLTRRTNRAAIVVMGNSIALYNPPVRVAEEFAMLDVISGGRLIAGFPVGSSQDVNFAYGMNPATFRDRYYEAEKLIVEAWTNPEVFAFDGKYNQIRYVNIWPRPIQQPHPPIWIPGGGSIETSGWCLEKSYLYAYLSYSGFKRGKLVMDGFWKKADELGIERNPYHAGFLQLVAVGQSASEVEERFGPHGEYFYNKMLHVYSGFQDAPGYRTIDTLKMGLLGQTTRFGDRPPFLTWKDLCANGNIVAGTPKQVTEQLHEVIKDLHIGHLMVLNQFGSIPHDLAMDNITLMGEQVLPKLKHIWDGQYEDKRWIKPLANRRAVSPLRASAALAGAR